MQEELRPNESNYDGLTDSGRSPWYRQLWDMLSRLDGCKLGIGAILVAIAIPGTTGQVKAIAVIVIGILAIGDELKKLNSYAESQDYAETQETEP